MARGTALITGASSGIGAELAKLCAAAGFDLALVSRGAPRLEELAADLTRMHGIQAIVAPADLADAAAPLTIFERLRGRPVEILINNAGIGLRGPFAETDWAVESRLLQINVTALAHLTKLFLPDMLRRRSGRILNVASTAALVPGPFMAVYYASKAFVMSFSESVANEVRGRGVTVTVLCPGPTRTGFFRAAAGEDIGLANGPLMDAADVARQGYRAMMAGKTVHVAGARNRWMMRAVRFIPRTVVANVTRRLNS